MKITWIGHSCFKIEQDGYAVIIDPYEDGSVPGLRPLREKANMVLCSHEHGDHSARERVEMVQKEVCPFTVEKINTWHDDARGEKRGRNIIHVIASGGTRIAHLGDLGCTLEEKELEQLQGLTVCMIPVGGFYTIDGKQAAELIRSLAPRLVIPMHYRDESAGFGFEVIDPVDVFAEQMDSLKVLNQSTISTQDLPDAQVVILKPRDLM